MKRKNPNAPMTDMEWRTTYAPAGYRFLQRIIDFRGMSDYELKLNLFSMVESMRREFHVAKVNPQHIRDRTWTWVHPHPRDVTERAGQYDHMGMRTGILIEMRIPL